jgi:dTDP-4-dehydrorhamnose reductase
MMKVLITGSKGQLGQTLQLNQSHHDVIAVDVDQLDITNLDAVMKFCQQMKPEVILNAAAYTAVDQAESDDSTAYAVNCTGVANLALAAKSVGARLIHISTDYVFSGDAHCPYMPTDSTAPIGVYGKTKLAGEEVLFETLGDQAVVVRTAWVYSIYANNFVKTMLRLMAERSELGVIADQVGSPTSTTDLARCLWQMAESNDCSGIYHFTNSGVASWYDFAVAIRTQAEELGLLNPDAAKIMPIRQKSTRRQLLGPITRY